jgi:tetratricopeptide (TPR) repeat protein
MLARFNNLSRIWLLSLLPGLLVLLNSQPVHSHDLLSQNSPRNFESRTGLPGQFQGVAGPASEEQRRILEDVALAKSLTAQGRLDEARQILMTRLPEAPQTVAPALARIIRLTNPEESAKKIVEALPETSTTLRARVLAAIGETTDALQLLNATPPSDLAQDLSAIVLLANLQGRVNGPEVRTQRLAEKLLIADSEAIRGWIFSDLLASAQIFAKLEPELFVKALEVGLQDLGRDNPRVLAPALDELILRIIQLNDYHGSRRARLFGLIENGTTARIWLGARLLIREEKHEEALKWIGENETRLREDSLWPLVAFEKAIALNNVGRVTEAAPIYAAIAERTTGLTRLNSLKEKARSEMARRDFAQAAETLRSVPFDELPVADRQLFHLAKIQVKSALRDIPGLVDAYTSAAPGLRYDVREPLHHAIFTEFIETREHTEIEEAVRLQFQQNPQTPPELWYLAAAAARSSRKTPNEIEALYQLNVAKPGDFEALRALAETIAPVARDLATVPTEHLAIPAEEVAKLQQLAEAALKSVIRSQPLNPDSYKVFLTYHQAKGTSETAARAAKEVVALESQIPEVKATAAYALAINGYPQQALLLYDAALELSPGNLAILMNRASCLTRLDRWDEALEFYYGVLLNGNNGQAYHVHELVDRIWRIEKHLGRPEVAIRRFHDVLNQIPSERFTEAVESMGILMMNEERFPESIRFFERHHAGSPDFEETGHAINFLAQIYLKTSQPAMAVSMLTTATDRYREFEDLWVDLTNLRAQAHATLDQIPKAIEALAEMASAFPNNSIANKAHYAIGQLQERAGNPNEAIKAYQTFLSGSSSDNQVRRQAEERLRELSSPPPNS